jgi:hypothetical protein
MSGEPPHVKPNIEFIYDQKEPKVQEIMSRLITAENPKLKYKESHDNKDIFSFTKEKSSQSEMIDIVKELFHITSESDSDNKSIVIELEKDSEFFNLLIKELTNAIRLQDETAEKFKNDISALESKMIKLVNSTLSLFTSSTYIIFRDHLHKKRQTCIVGARYFLFTWTHVSSKQAVWRNLKSKCSGFLIN